MPPEFVEESVETSALKPASSPWPFLAASLGLALLSFVLGRLYSKLHWKVLFVGGRLRECVDDSSFSAALQVLDDLWLARIVAALGAAGFGIWGIVRAKPVWPNVVATAIAALALALASVIE